MAGLLWWELTHALCILGHLGLIIASFTAFAFTREVLGSDDFLSTKLVPFEAFGVGGFATISNSTLFTSLRRLQRHSRDEPVEARYFKKKVATLLGCVFNLFFVAADSAIAVNLKKGSNKVADHSSSNYLKSLSALAVICTVLAFATIVADTVRILEDRAHKRDFDEQYEYQTAGPIQLA